MHRCWPSSERKDLLSQKILTANRSSNVDKQILKQNSTANDREHIDIQCPYKITNKYLTRMTAMVKYVKRMTNYSIFELLTHWSRQ